MGHVHGVVTGGSNNGSNLRTALGLTLPLVGRFLFTDFNSLALFKMAEKVEGLILVETWILTGGSLADKVGEEKGGSRIFNSVASAAGHIYITAYLIWCHQLKFLSDVERLKCFSRRLLFATEALAVYVADIIVYLQQE